MTHATQGQETRVNVCLLHTRGRVCMLVVLGWVC